MRPATRNRFKLGPGPTGWSRARESSVVFAIAGAVLIFSLLNSSFFSLDTLMDTADASAILIVLAVGQTLVVLTRSIDLSSGSVVGLSAFIAGSVLANNPQVSFWVIAAGAVVVGLILGAANGLLITLLGIPPIVTTLATLSIFRAVLFALQDQRGTDVFAYQLPESFQALTRERFLGLSVLLWIALLAVALATVWLKRTGVGRDLYAIGSNPEGAARAGIPAGKRVLLAFTLCGGMSGLAGFMFLTKFATVSVTSGAGYEFLAITAVVLGGVNLFGGSGTALGAALGAVLLGTINSGLAILGMHDFWQSVFAGVAIVLAISVDTTTRRRAVDVARRDRWAKRHLGSEERVRTESPPDNDRPS